MQRSRVIPILIAVAFTVFVVVMVASSLGGSSAGTHVMPSGQTMDSTTMK